MKKWLIALLLIAPLTVWAVDKFLQYQFNENVIIKISNIPCKIPAIDNKKYPYAALAKRSDNQYLFGCFTNEGDIIVIQWAEGDQTRLPANYFLGEKVEPNT